MSFIWTKKYPDYKLKVFNEIVPLLNYNRCNPNMVKTSEGYDIIIRLVNYTIENDHDYKTIIPNSCINTQNIIAKYNKNLDLISYKIIKDSTDRKIYTSFITGFEDMRQVIIDNKKYATASCADSNSQGIPETVLLKLDNNIITSCKRLEPTFETSRRKEKNWLPFENNGNLQVIYKNFPFTIHEINTNTGNYKAVIQKNTEKIMESFRGSAGPIKYKNGYLYIVHQASYGDNWLYTSRWVLVTEENIKFSDEFYFLKKGIEFACGLCWSHIDNEVLVGCSVRDLEANCITIKLEDILDSLN